MLKVALFIGIIIHICSVTFIMGNALAALPIQEDNTEASIQSAITQQKAEKAAITTETQAKKDKITQKNARAVERIKKEIKKTTLHRENDEINSSATLTSAIIVLIALLFFIKRKK